LRDTRIGVFRRFARTVPTPSNKGKRGTGGKRTGMALHWAPSMQQAGFRQPMQGGGGSDSGRQKISILDDKIVHDEIAQRAVLARRGRWTASEERRRSVFIETEIRLPMRCAPQPPLGVGWTGRAETRRQWSRSLIQRRRRRCAAMGSAWASRDFGSGQAQYNQ